MAKPRISIRISDDGMVAIATIEPGEPAGAVELEAALVGAGVGFGVDEAVCRALGDSLADPGFHEAQVEVACGRRVEPGTDGFFEPSFHVGIQAGALREDGKIDFWDRELLKPVAEGTLVGRLHSPVEGVAGQRVDGGIVPAAAVSAARLRLGPGVAADQEGDVRARARGVVVYAPDKVLDVVDHLVHRGDVDLHSGHLVMEGTLAVQGDVQRLFSVRASEDVEIRGSVQGGSVFAGGELRIKNGVIGGGTGMVCAEGNFRARHAESARIVSGGVLELESAVNCHLSAEEIKVTRVLRGGKAEAEQLVVAQEVGSPHGGLGTVLSAAVPLERPVFEARRALAAAKTMSLMNRHGAAAGRSAGERTKTGKWARAAIGARRSEYERKLEVAARREVLMGRARVHVGGTCHAGVIVEIGKARLVLDEDQRGVQFSFDSETGELRMERASK